MTISTITHHHPNLLLAAEIGGGWLVWQTIREKKPWYFIVAGLCCCTVCRSVYVRVGSPSDSPAWINRGIVPQQPCHTGLSRSILTCSQHSLPLLYLVYLPEVHSVCCAAGFVVLCAYGLIPTLQPSEASFSRVYAVYGGFFVVMSYGWGWAIDGDKPDLGDFIGAAVALAGVMLCWFWPRTAAAAAAAPGELPT